MAERVALRQRLGRAASVGGAGLGIGLFWVARQAGAFMNALFLFLVAGAFAVLSARGVALARRRVSFRAYREPRQHLPELGAALLRIVACLTFAWAVNIAVVPIQFAPHELSQVRAVTWVAAAMLVLAALVPRDRRWVPADTFFLLLWLLALGDIWRALRDTPATDAVEVASPFENEAYVLQGGGSPLINHHFAIPQQTWALDLVTLTPDGRLTDGGNELGSYPCFGAPVLSPVAGTVAAIVKGRPDMAIGQFDREVLAGNSVSIETASGAFVVLAHLQAGSIEVAEEQPVTVGQRIARCGNSGNSSLPHVHLQAQNRPHLTTEDPLLRALPIRFVQGQRVRGDHADAAPFTARRNDRILPAARAAL